MVRIGYAVSCETKDIANQLKNRLLSSPETCLKPHDFGLDTRPFLSRLAIQGIVSQSQPHYGRTWLVICT